MQKFKCPICGSIEVTSIGLRIKYECGSSDHDPLPNQIHDTFKQSKKCKALVREQKLNTIL